MIHISVVARSSREVVLKIAGHLTRENAPILAREGDHWLRQSEVLVLELAEVQFVDRAGLALLQRWATQKLVLRGAIPFIRTLLEQAGLQVEKGGS
jgi:ABC-type transporter Mla MlaB component